MATTLFNNLITFSRGTNATLVGANGLVQYAPNNLLTYSEQFDNAAWTKVNATVTANSTTAPDGTTTADLVTVTGASGRALESTVFTAAAQTFSVYLKASSTTDTLLRIVDVTPTTSTLTLSWSGGVPSFVSNTGSGYAIQSVGNGWYRVSITATTAAGSGSVQVYANGSNSSGATLLWGAQLELGTTATTYNSTTVKNLLGYSEAFDNAAWTKTGSSIVTAAQANPLNGLFTAQKLMESTAAGNHRVQQSFTSATGVTYTFSCYAKAAERTWVYLYDDISNAFAYFDLATGTVGTVGAGWTSTSITSVGSGWYRISATATDAAGGGGNQLIGLASANGTSTYTGDGNSGVYIYGAQLSDSGSLDPYVPTPGAAPTSAAYYGPRFDYDPVTLQPKGLLIEEARTNLLTYSEQFDNAAWTKSDNTITANSAVSPDGSANADTATPTGATPIVRQTYTTSTTGAYTGTIWLKSSSSTNVTISLRPTGAGSPVSVVCAVTSTWQRFTVNLTAVAGVTNIQFWVEQFSQGIYLWGAQLEAGSFATSYIPTVASTVTRSADVVTITGSLFSGWYNQSAGTFVVGASFLNTASGGFSRIVEASDGTNNNAISVLKNSTTAQMYTNVNTGGVAQATLFGSITLTTAPFKAVSAYKLNDFGWSFNGETPSTDASGTLPTVNRLNIGTDGYTAQTNGHIRSITYLPVRNADYQIQGFTA